MKTGYLGFAALAWALPLQAQEAVDPLAPIDQPAPATAQPQPVVVMPPPQPPQPVVNVPRDWRGVFDAIDAGQWASAQAGINALGPNVLTPVAKAQLYTAKGSPTVSLAAAAGSGALASNSSASGASRSSNAAKAAGK